MRGDSQALRVLAQIMKSLSNGKLAWDWFPDNRSGEVYLEGIRHTIETDSRGYPLFNDQLRPILHRLEELWREARNEEGKTS